MTDSIDAPLPLSRRWLPADWWIVLTLGLAAFALYYQTRTFDYVNYDDPLYVGDNRFVQAGLSVENIKWASKAIVVANWHPLTLYVMLTLSSLFKATPATFHLANAVIHAGVVGLVFVFLRNATGRLWPAAFVAALWGLHPLRAESVAWVSELKDVLCGLMVLLTLIAYTRYCRRRTIGRYALVVGLFALSLLAKPMAATIPAVLLLLDYWPLNDQPGGWVRRVAEKLPLVAMSVADIWYALVTQQQTLSIGTSGTFPLSLRLANAAVSLVAYLRDTVWPARIGLFYPHPAMLAPSIPRPGANAIGVSFLLLIGLTAAAIVVARRHRYVLVGWLWFLGMLVPVLGFVQLGEQARADRYTYLPSIGLMTAVVWLVADKARRPAARTAAVAVGGLAVIGYTSFAGYYVSCWKNTDSLSARSLVIPNNYLAMTMQAEAEDSRDRLDRATDWCIKAVEASPESLGPRLAYGSALFKAKRYPEALDQFQKAESLAPQSERAWDGLGNVYHMLAGIAAEQKAPKEAKFRNAAVTCYSAAVARDPESYVAEDHLAVALARVDRFDEAFAHWKSVTTRYPRFGYAHGHFGDALLAKGQYVQALDQYAAAYDTGLHDPKWESYLAGMTSTNPSASPEVCAQMVAVARDAVTRTNETNPLALDALGESLARVTMFEDAAVAADKSAALYDTAGEKAKAADVRKRAAKYRAGTPELLGEK